MGGVFMRTNYDIVGDKIRDFWRKNHPQDVIAFFSQKYKHEEMWEFCAEFATSRSSNDYETVIFEDDFWEGQEEIKDIEIVPLEEIIEFYLDNRG